MSGWISQTRTRSGRVTLDRAAHATRAATTTSELASGDGHDLDAVLAQERVGRGVALIPEDHARSHCEEVVAVVPLLACSAHLVDRSLQWPDLLDSNGLGHGGPHVGVLH